MSATEYHNQDDVDALRDALFGRSVVSVQQESERKLGYGETAQGEVHLDDGSVLLLAGNVGGCSCGAGDYDLTALNDMPINGITDVQVEVTDKQSNPDADEWYEDAHVYTIFVLAKDERIRLADFDGDDGNGYYGTGFWFRVESAGAA